MEYDNRSKKSKKVVLPEMKTKEQKFVHLCDYLASRKDITVTNEDGTPLVSNAN